MPVAAVRPKSSDIPILSERMEGILRAVHFHRYMTAEDVTNLLYSPGSLTRVRSILTSLAGGGDWVPNQYLYRFRLPTARAGNREMVFTLGSRGRDFLANDLGLPVNWYFRPDKVKRLSFNQVSHSLFLTRFLVAAQLWSKRQDEFKLAKRRISYQLARAPGIVEIGDKRSKETHIVIPDAWLLFERAADSKKFPILLEIDRGTEYQQKFKHHVRGRLEFIRSGSYRQAFGVEAVVIAYVTTGSTANYRETRQRTMSVWTMDVLKEMGMAGWAHLFRFHALTLDEIYTTKFFADPVWIQPDRQDQVKLFAS